MFELSANISLLYQEFPFLERIKEAEKSGFRAIEVMYPYAYSAHAVRDELLSRNMALSVLNAPPGNHANGERGLAALPGREQDFKDSLDQAIEYAVVTHCQNIHVLTGNLANDVDQTQAMQTLRENLLYCAAIFAENNLTLLLEPLSRQMLPAYSLPRVEDAHYWISQLKIQGYTNVGLQLDLYHTQMEQGNLAALIKRYISEISYVQIAGVPGRHEPTIGEINYRYLLDQLSSLGFTGWVGCEYIPKDLTHHGLSWARDWGLLPTDRSPPSPQTKAEFSIE